MAGIDLLVYDAMLTAYSRRIHKTATGERRSRTATKIKDEVKAFLHLRYRYCHSVTFK